jgi:hypothetical protein
LKENVSSFKKDSFLIRNDFDEKIKQEIVRVQKRNKINKIK